MNKSKKKQSVNKYKVELKQVFRNSICACICTLQLHSVLKLITDIRRPQMNKNQKYKLLENKYN